MDSARIRDLLRPFFEAQGLDLRSLSFQPGVDPEESAVLTESQVQQLSAYLDLLLRWNSRVNLTAIREPQEIVSRHFGESLFAAQQLFPPELDLNPQHPPRLLDFGSGAGFPGLPIKIWAPRIELILIESNQKKATFLREVIRALGLDSADVLCGRAEDFQHQADVVSVRAVEQFERSLPIAAHLVATGGRLALLIGESQVSRAQALERKFHWQPSIPIPLSSNRVLLIGTKGSR